LKLTGTGGALNGFTRYQDGIALLILVRAAGGAVAASAIAFIARRLGSLSPSGAGATIVVGSSAAAAGWNWGALLIAYFVAVTVFSRLGGAEKARITGGVVVKGGARDAAQVIANGGVFAASVLLGQFGSGRFSFTMAIAALGALAASSADTWATEIGTLYGGTPRSMLTFQHVPRGTSRGVSVVGTMAMIAGAAYLAVVAMAIGLPDSSGIVIAAGVAGATADSLLGAVVQERRWCAVCGMASERRVHDCGAPTVLAGGREWMDNDLVNLIATVVGAGVAALLVNL
jgi:uncharacterized protein (TIGR00297 family)